MHCGTKHAATTLTIAALALALAAGCSDGDAGAAASGGAGGQGAGGAASVGGSGGEGGSIISPLAVQFVATTALPMELTQRWGHVAAWMGDNRAVVFGGTRQGAEPVVLTDAWLVDGSGPEPTATPIAAAATPVPRYCGCAVWDAARERMVAIGGRDLGGPLAAETWELDVATGSWTMMAVAASPPGVIGCAAARASDGTIYLFGGGSDAGFDSGTYRYDPSVPSWTALDISGPSGRYDAVMRARDDGSLLLFGGSANSTFHADMWRFDPATESWTEMPMQGMVPVGRRAAWFMPAPDGGLYVGFGLQGAQPLGDLFHASMGEPPTWTAVAFDAAPGPRAFTPALPGGLGLLFGGFDGAAPLADAWQLSVLP
jgi:Kelch motif